MEVSLMVVYAEDQVSKGNWSRVLSNIKYGMVKEMLSRKKQRQHIISVHTVDVEKLKLKK